jgi:hypothetical protein
VEQLSLRDGGIDDNNGPRQVSEAGPSATDRYAGFGRANDSTGMRDADGWGGMRIGEANRLLLCAAKNETSVDTMRRMFCCNFLRKSRL